jgi:acyl carrier protein
MDSLAALVKILRKVTGIKAVNITEKTSFHDDLGVDSVDMTELIMELETELNVEISDEDVEMVKTVGELIVILDSKLNQEKVQATATG